MLAQLHAERHRVVQGVKQDHKVIKSGTSRMLAATKYLNLVLSHNSRRSFRIAALAAE